VGKKRRGGGCLYEFASHCIDLAVFLFGSPDSIKGSVLEKVYSSRVEDFVSSTFLYDNGCTGSITVNWSDPTYRKPTNIVNISGTAGKIISDKHSYKIYIKDEDPTGRFKKGWNTRYLTDFTEGIRFYLRGNEFTRQLDYFVDCVENGVIENVSSFSDALETDILIDKICEDAEQPALKTMQALASEKMVTEENRAKSFWNKLLNKIR